MDSKSLTPYSNTLSFMETQSRFSHSTVIFANLLKNLQTCKWTYCSTFLTKITATCKNTLGASAFCIFTVRQICYDVIMTWLTSRTDQFSTDPPETTRPCPSEFRKVQTGASVRLIFSLMIYFWHIHTRYMSWFICTASQTVKAVMMSMSQYFIEVITQYLHKTAGVYREISRFPRWRVRRRVTACK